MIGINRMACAVLIATALAFVAEWCGFDVVADFVAVSRFDAPIWAVFLLALAYGQWRLSGSSCDKCRLWGHFVLQLSGLVLLLLGLTFVAAYPPFSHLMAFFPMFGLYLIFAGRRLSDAARAALMGKGRDE